MTDYPRFRQNEAMIRSRLRRAMHASALWKQVARRASTRPVMVIGNAGAGASISSVGALYPSVYAGVGWSDAA